MPTKPGGGNNPENYNPNDGKYLSDGVKNKYYDNPDENKIFNLVSNCFPKSFDEKNRNENILKVSNWIFSLKNDDKKNIILNFLKNKKIRIDFINATESKYDSGQGLFLSINLENKSIFFHEIGHAFDDLYKEKYFELSTNFVENNKDISDYMIEDFKKNKEKLLNSYNEMLENKIFEEFKKNNLIYKSFDEKKKEFEIEKQNKINFLSNENEKILKEYKRKIYGLSKEEIDKIQKEEYFIKLNEKFIENNKKKEQIKSQEFENSYSEIEEKIIYDSLDYISEKFGNISDAYNSLTGDTLGRYGHRIDYWNRTTQKNEFFANFFQSFIEDDEFALNQYKLFFPQTYDKILKIIDIIKEKQKADEIYGL